MVVVARAALFNMDHKKIDGKELFEARSLPTGF